MLVTNLGYPVIAAPNSFVFVFSKSKNLSKISFHISHRCFNKIVITKICI